MFQSIRARALPRFRDPLPRRFSTAAGPAADPARGSADPGHLTPEADFRLELVSARQPSFTKQRSKTYLSVVGTDSSMAKRGVRKLTVRDIAYFPALVFLLKLVGCERGRAF